MSFALRHALRRLSQLRQAGELRILALAVLVAVAAATAVGLFGDRLRAALDEQSGDSLGADMLVTGRDPLPPALAREAQELGLRQTAFTGFPSLLLAGERSALAAAKAVAAGYPLRGELRVADLSYAPPRPTRNIPAPGTAWADVRLWSELGLAPNAMLQLGETQLRVTAVLEYEPDRGAGFFDLAPRLLINASDVAATGLVGPTSRVQYGLMLAGPATAIAALRARPEFAALRWTGPQESRPQIRRAIERAGLFLDIAVLAVALLAAAAVGLSAQQHGQRLRDEAALLKCLGASRGQVLRALALNLLLLGGCGALLGALLGYAGQALLAGLIGNLLPNFTLPAPAPQMLLPPVALALIVLLGFALPPVLEAGRVPPVRVFQRALGDDGRTRLIWLAAAAATLLLLAAQTRDAELAALVLGGSLATLGVLALLAWSLVRLLAPLQRAVRTSWRFGLGSIARRRGGSVAQIVALGLGLLALLLVTVVRQDLLDRWRARLPADTPNVFLINIQPGQLNGLRSFFAVRGHPQLNLWPMARGRLVAMNGRPVTPESFDDPETQRWINRDFNISWSETLGDDNRITGGEWWGAAGRGQAWLSADEYAVERLDLKLGDTLTLQFADQSVTLTVRNLRSVDWGSFRPNFFLLAPPGVLDRVPAQWITSFHLPPAQRALLRELVAAYPNVTALDLEAAMNQVRGIVERILRAVEFILLFALAAGVVVLLAAIEGTRAERARETALLRALGARSALLRSGLLAEFATLGVAAGLVAAIAAQGLAWALAAQLLEIPYGPRPLLWLIGAGSGAALVTALGWLSLRRVLATPPGRVLQGSG